MDILYIEKMMWAIIAAWWLVSALFVKKSLKKQSGWQRIAYITCVILAFSLLFENYFPFAFMNRPVLPQGIYWKLAGLMLCAAGLAFALAARIYLGKNWSGRITIKENHELVQSGPYSITRNPIYTGFLLAFCGCSMSLGLVKGYLGILLLLACLMIKISTEEKFMLELFGEKFRAYQVRVKRLVPLIY